MKLEVHIEKRHLVFLVLLVGVVALGFVVAYTDPPGANKAATVGHSVDEIKWSQLGSCGAGSSIRQINDDGTVVCESDDVGSSESTSWNSLAGKPAAIDSSDDYNSGQSLLKLDKVGCGSGRNTDCSSDNGFLPANLLGCGSGYNSMCDADFDGIIDKAEDVQCAGCVSASEVQSNVFVTDVKIMAGCTPATCESTFGANYQGNGDINVANGPGGFGPQGEVCVEICIKRA
jgi:hypothetical protein